MKGVSSRRSIVSKSAFRFALYALLFAVCEFGEAQQPAKVPRIGYLRVVGAPSVPGPNVEAFRRRCETSVMLRGETL
jgi:hypothetical protein